MGRCSYVVQVEVSTDGKVGRTLCFMVFGLGIFLYLDSKVVRPVGVT